MLNTRDPSERDDSKRALTGLAVVLEAPNRLGLRPLQLTAAGAEDVVIDVEWSGISTGTEKLLWSGDMPPFPGLSYPLVPGYETVGRVAAAGERSGRHVGERVFVPGARCYQDVAGLFGGAAQRIVSAGARTTPIPDHLAADGVLLALAATAFHALRSEGGRVPDLIVGHGVLGRLLARLAVLRGGAPVVWEQTPARTAGAAGYEVRDPAQDPRRDYRCVVDASGDPAIIDRVVPHMARGGELVLAGFYSGRLAFSYPPAFQRELRLRVAAEWEPTDLAATSELVARGELSLAGLITHRHAARDAEAAYRTAFTEAGCLKMILDWRDCP
jgi:3-hydroxyethyl bacteriochlorophyllide a dehydrogenase